MLHWTECSTVELHGNTHHHHQHYRHSASTSSTSSITYSLRVLVRIGGHVGIMLNHGFDMMSHISTAFHTILHRVDHRLSTIYFSHVHWQGFPSFLPRPEFTCLFAPSFNHVDDWLLDATTTTSVTGHTHTHQDEWNRTKSLPTVHCAFTPLFTTTH